MSSEDLTLYHATASPNSRRVRIFLAEKGLTPLSFGTVKNGGAPNSKEGRFGAFR
jgi:glutathione S-transferase